MNDHNGNLSNGKLKPARSLSMINGSRRLNSQYSMPSSLNKRKETYLFHFSKLDEQIINCQLTIAAKKDFREEVRALVDVRKFVADSFILTDVIETRIKSIVEYIVDSLVKCRGLDEQVANEAKSLLFVDQNSFDMLLSNTMQGLYKSSIDGRVAYDNSWIVASGILTSLSKRQVAIARFPQPINFGRESREVRFLIIILAPNKEKLTKSAWETGRTFATMFSDLNFRRSLLRAKNHDEFRMELLTRAENLARESEDYLDSLHTLSANLSTISAKSGAPLTDYQFDSSMMRHDHHRSPTKQVANSNCLCNMFNSLGSGLLDDFKRRSKVYLSDFTDGIIGDRSFYKTISTTVFLYFSVLLPCIAFGVVDTNNTNGSIDPRKTMIGQAIGGLMFAFFSGQPLVVIMTTAPLCIYVKVIYEISQDLGVEFSSFYACVGIWMFFFLVIASMTNLSNLMKYCTRSTEDIFALFTAFAFGFDGIKEAIRSFKKYYWEPDCQTHATVLASRTIPESLAAATTSHHNNLSSLMSGGGNGGSHLVSLLKIAQNNLTNAAVAAAAASSNPIHSLHATTYTTSPLTLSSNHINNNNNDLINDDHLHHPNLLHHNDMDTAARCRRETCVLFLFLMCGTLWLANTFSYFDKTPYLSSRKREVIKDYALAISVLIFSFISSYLFADIRMDSYEWSDFTSLQIANLGQMSSKVLATGCLLGFMLAVLFYIDQNICGAMVNNAPYKLKKGDYFHMDLLIVAAINLLLSLTGLPWMHGKLPHSHLHAKALADYEERVDEGHVHQTIVNIRETRLTSLFCSLLIGLSLLAIPYPLSYIPLPVLSGVFLYTALAEMKSNSMVERICLLFTEQCAYPPNHYIRRCPQRKIHLFTITQIVQLAIVAFVGFYPNPYVNMAFPLVVATFVPIRDKLLPYLIDIRYLNSLDHASSD